MNLNQLYYLQAIAQARGLTRAADALYVTQSNLSHSMAALEEELGIPLLYKNGRDTLLTPYGQEFLAYAERAIQEIEEGKRVAQSRCSPTRGQVRLGFISAVSATLIPCWRSWPGNTGSPRPRSACASPWTAAWFPCPSQPTLDGCARTWRWTLPWRRRTWSGCGPCPRQAGPACTRTSEPAGQKRARPPPRMRGGRAFPYLFVRLVLGADLQHKVPEPLDRGQDPAVLGAEHIEHAVGLSVRDVEGTDRVEPEAEHAGHDAHP